MIYRIFNCKNKFIIANKVWDMLMPAERRNALVLLALMLIGMVLETLGVGLVIPALALLTQSDIALDIRHFNRYWKLWEIRVSKLWLSVACCCS